MNRLKTIGDFINKINADLTVWSGYILRDLIPSELKIDKERLLETFDEIRNFRFANG